MFTADKQQALLVQCTDICSCDFPSSITFNADDACVRHTSRGKHQKHADRKTILTIKNQQLVVEQDTGSRPYQKNMLRYLQSACDVSMRLLDIGSA